MSPHHKVGYFWGYVTGGVLGWQPPLLLNKNRSGWLGILGFQSVTWFHRFFFGISEKSSGPEKLNLLRGLLYVTNSGASGVDIALKSLGCFSLNLKLRKPPCLLDPKNSMAAHSKTASNWASFTMSCALRSFQCELEKNQFHNKFDIV